MELFGIILSGPAALVLSTVYCVLLAKLGRGFERVRRVLYAASQVILGQFLVESILLFTLGAVQSRSVVGPGFSIAHLVCFTLGMPAMANVLMLNRHGSLMTRLFSAVSASTIFAVLLVVLQYIVSEALYGQEGQGGPFSLSPWG